MRDAVNIEIVSGTYDIGAMPDTTAVHRRHLHGLLCRRDAPTDEPAGQRDSPLPAWDVGDDRMPARANHLRDPSGQGGRNAFAAALLDRPHP
jgi:hypothetical protein